MVSTESYALAFSNVLASKRKLQGNKQFKIWSHNSHSASTPTSLLHTRISSMAASENISVQKIFGCEKELEAALLCLRGDKADISHEAIEIKDYVESLKIFSSEGILDIFQKKYVWPLLTVAEVLVLMNLGGINALTYYSGAIFVTAGVSSMVGLITLAATQILKVRQRIQSLQAGKAKA
ncbi:hypothetical protein PVK06_002460 [Gossypium arboreum]|uniref:Uncharacterized protein n=1 Tax=Gossypium arboreum TaxID=29729 RepID=A0ABR0R4R7_GOSAR|nr:hypothetical protein PVK06_002460 [Gossypium arboreum]